MELRAHIILILIISIYSMTSQVLAVPQILNKRLPKTTSEFSPAALIISKKLSFLCSDNL